MKLKLGWNWQVATFFVGCLVMLTMVFAAVMNWLAFEHRKQMFAQMAELVVRVEAVERMKDTRTRQLPPPQERQ